MRSGIRRLFYLGKWAQSSETEDYSNLPGGNYNPIITHIEDYVSNLGSARPVVESNEIKRNQPPYDDDGQQLQQCIWPRPTL